MDSRESVRSPLALRVVLGYPKLGMLSGLTSNVSLGGMFVETAPISLPRNEIVSVYLHLPGHEAENLCVTDAQVIHGRGGGVGLAFRRLGGVARTALSELLATPDGSAGDAERFMTCAGNAPAGLESMP